MSTKLSIATALAFLILTGFLTTLIAAQGNAGRCIVTNYKEINQNFTKDLHQLISVENSHLNVVYSPISLETILALVYTGASGKTADELSTVLGMPRNNIQIYQRFERLMKSRRTGKMELQMANNLYIKKGLKASSRFRKNAKRYFDAKIRGIRFTKKERAAKKINRWVAKKTNNMILNLVSPDSLHEDTLAMLVNAIYFKGIWAKEFSPEETAYRDFWVKECEHVSVEMMYRKDTFKYADLSNELGAQILQLPYADSDMSMLLVLPDDVEGLAEVESRLRAIDLRKLPERMQEELVEVHIPKFRIELEIYMNEFLKKLKIKSLFKDYYGLGGIFGEHQQARISEMKHVAVIDVNEAGSEAASVTSIKVLDRAFDSLSFRADHPFMFAIISPQTVYFVGHVVDPQMICEKM